MAIEINQIKEERGKRSLFVLFILLFFIILFSGIYFYLFISTREVESKIREKEEEIRIILNERKEREDNINRYNKNISDFKKILDSHKNIVRVFSIIENLSHPYVWFPSFNFQVDSGNVNLSGIARDFTSVGQQIIILKSVPGLRDISIFGIQAVDNGVSFSVSFNVDTQILR